MSVVSRSGHSRNSISVNGIFCTILFSLLIFNCQAQTATRGGKVDNIAPKSAVTGTTYAIIFGISNYPGLIPLKYADKDAALFRDFLESPAGGNVKPENIFYRTNEEAKAAVFNVEARIWVKSRAMKEGDRLYIYFSGHGDALDPGNYLLLPYDCMPNNDPNLYLATGRIEMYQIKTLFIKPQTDKKVEVLLIVDACRTNDLPGGTEGQQNFAQSVAEQRAGEIIMLSAGAGQQAIESSKIGNGHGLFTWYLIAGLSGDADKEGDAADQDGKVSLAEITSYVKNHVRKDAKTLFNSNQVPVFLPPDKDLETIATVDNASYQNWKVAENMRQQTNGGSNLVAMAKGPGKKSGAGTGTGDTALITLDNKFIVALKTGKLLGENSAEAFYNKMKEKWPDQPVTDEAKYALATEFINFGQEKINLFLSGKGIVQIQHMENEFKTDKKGGPNKNAPPVITEQIDRMKTLTITGFDKAAEMMDKAVKLLNTDPELLEQIYPKLYFLRAAAYDKVNNITGRRQAIALLKKAIKKDSVAAYNYLMIGHIYYELKNDSCELYFKKAISLAPKWADPENGIANFYSEKKNKALAIMHFNRAVKLDSLDALAVQNIGVLYSDEGKMDSAKLYFMKALTIDPCDRYANGNMGYLHSTYMKSNTTADPDFKIAERYFRKDLGCDSNFSRPYLQLAGLFDKVNRPDSSMFYLNLGIRKNPDDAALYRMQGDEYFMLKDTLKAELTYLKGLKVDSLDINNHYSLIWLYENGGENNGHALKGRKIAFANAVLYAQKALKVDPASAYSYNALGNVNVNLELYEKAVPNYEKAIKLDSTYVDAYNGLGNAWFYQKNYDKAQLNYQKAIAANPKLAYGYSNLADVYFNQKDYDKALVNYRKAFENDPTYLYPCQRIGIIYNIKRDYPAAIQYLKKATKLDPTNAAMDNVMGNIYYDLKKYDTAIIFHQRAIQLAPRRALYYSDLGYANDALNRGEEAMSYYKKAIEIDSSYAAPYINLGYSYQKLRQYDKAVASFKTALLRNPKIYLLNDAIGSAYKELKDYNKEIYYFKKTLAVDSTNDTYLNDLAFAYLYTKDYKNGIACLQKMLTLYPQDKVSYYNLACGYSITNNPDMGMTYLKTAMEKGLKDYALISNDEALGNLRKQPEFNTLMKQYFPDKVK